MVGVFMYIKELNTDEFNKFTNSFPISSIFQTTEYGIVMDNEGFDPLYIGLIDDNENIILSITQLLIIMHI